MSSFWKRFGPHAHRVRMAAVAHPDLLRRLADAPDKTFHVYAIRLNALLRTDPAAGPDAVAHALGERSLAALVEVAWGSVPTGTVSALDRLGEAVRDAAFYDRLRAVLSDARLARLLRRTKGHIDEAALARIEAMARFEPAFDVLFGEIPPRALRALQWLLGRLRANGVAISGRELEAQLKTLTRQSWGRVIRDLIAMHPPVPAPWPGNDRLKPLESPGELQRIAKAMNNCLGEVDFALELIRGTEAFYLWEGKTPAITQIVLVAPGEWELKQQKGPRNSAVDDETFGEIADAFAAAGISSERRTPWLTNHEIY